MARDLPTTPGAAVRGFYSHPSPIVLTVLLVGFSTARVWIGGWSLLDLVIPAALLVWWPLHEWIIHITVLHARPVSVGGRTLDMKVARIHRRHHADPWHLPDVFIPFHIVYWTGIPLIAAAYLLLPVPLATGGLAFYLLMSLHYEWCHYLAHIDWCPRLGFYRRRVRLHRLHHFQHERLWWGVSTDLGDRLLGTGPKAENAPNSNSTHDLLAGPWFRVVERD